LDSTLEHLQTFVNVGYSFVDDGLSVLVKNEVKFLYKKNRAIHKEIGIGKGVSTCIQRQIQEISQCLIALFLRRERFLAPLFINYYDDQK